MIRGVAVGIACAIASLAALSADTAAGQSCRAIEREMRQIESGRGGGGSSRYEEAYHEQAAVLSQARRQARQAGCMGGGFLFFRSQPQRVCRSLLPKISKMQANLGKLDRLRKRGGNSRSANQRRLRTLHAMAEDRGCWGAEPQEVRREFDEETIFETPVQRGGTVRTLCVRACDGYYFPISYATTRDQIAMDSQTCQTMCPGATAELYYHSNPGSGPEEMISVTGAAYSRLPTAFQFRTSFNPSCTCNSKTGINYALIQTQLPGSTPGEPPTGNQAATPANPAPRPSPGEDPETVANIRGHFTPRFVNAASNAMVTSQAQAGDRHVRVVGPAYWGAQEKEGVVLTPVPN